MFKATQKNLPTDIAVFAAAVGDFKVSHNKKEKIKKLDNFTLILEKNVDILSYVSNHNSMRPKIVVGFAAETTNIEENALKKLKNKNCDWIIANDVSKNETGFDSENNEVMIFYKNKNMETERLSLKKKSEISEEIVDRLVAQLN